MSAAKHLRLVRSNGRPPAEELPTMHLNRFVTPSQMEAIDMLLMQWDKTELLPGILDALNEDLDHAIRTGLRKDFHRVIGMADGITLLLDYDPRVERIRERAEILSREIGSPS